MAGKSRKTGDSHHIECGRTDREQGKGSGSVLEETDAHFDYHDTVDRRGSQKFLLSGINVPSAVERAGLRRKFAAATQAEPERIQATGWDKNNPANLYIVNLLNTYVYS